MTERPLKDIRAALTEKTIDILAGYRKNFSTSHPPGQLVLPENLKEFAMYILALIKSKAFKGELSRILAALGTENTHVFGAQGAMSRLTGGHTTYE